MIMEFKKKLLLIDGHALFHRAFHAIPGMTSPSGFPTGAIFGFLSMFFKALNDIKPTHALVTFDVKGPTFRDKLSTDYKATRKAPDEEMVKQLPKLKEILQALDIPIYEQAGFEADDLLGIITHKTPKDVLNIIVTGDLDLLQLIDNHTQVYRFKIGFSDIQIFDIDKMVAVYGLHPSQWVDYKALRGDPSDNIPGVPGIGQKGGLELVKEFGSLDAIYTAVERKDQRIKPGTLKKLEAGKVKAYLSYKLSYIDQKNGLDFDFDKCLMGDYDQQKVLELLHMLGIKALDNRLPKVSGEAVSKGIFDAKAIAGKPNDLIHSQEEALIAAYLLNPGQREYETGDWVKLAKELKENNLLKIFQEIEVPLIQVLARMHERGIKLDLKWLSDLSKKLNERIGQLVKQIHKLAGLEFNISSPMQLREILFDKLQIPTENLRKTGKTKAYSTDATTLEKLQGVHPIIDLVFEYRELTKLKSTYVDALPELVSKSDLRLHTSYNQTIAATGRLSSSEPNLQNIPIRSELGNQVRQAFVSDTKKVLLSLDYSQIELRIAASLSEDPEMMKIFNNNGDFHTATASKIFEVSPDKVTPAQRRDAKTINFSILYGVSAFGLSERSDMGRGEAAEYIRKYYQVFSVLKQYIDALIQQAHQDGFLTNSFGRIRYFPEIHSAKYGVRSASERQAVNMPIQSLAADIIKMAMIEIEKRFQNNPSCQMLLSVHDELVFEVDPKETEKYAGEIKNIMETVYQLKVPIKVEAKVGNNWAVMEKLEI